MTAALAWLAGYAIGFAIGFWGAWTYRRQAREYLGGWRRAVEGWQQTIELNKACSRLLEEKDRQLRDLTAGAASVRRVH